MNALEDPPPPTVTVVIATHDNRARVLETLDALARQVSVDYQEFDVIVVADGCSDGSAGALRAYSAPFRLTIIDQVHSGLAPARNRGLEAAGGTITVFLDDDVIPDPEFIATHRRLHPPGSNVVVLGAIKASTQNRSSWDAYDDAMREKRQRALRTVEQPSGIHSASNVSMPRDLARAMGGFRGHLPGNQEVELGYRLRQAGAQFVFSPDASARDNSVTSYKSWKEKQSTRGKLDVATYGLNPDGQGLDHLLACFRERRLLGRVVVASLLRHRRIAPHVINWAERAAVLAYALSLHGVSRAAYSVVANALYWGAVRDVVRGNKAFFALLKRSRHASPLARRLAPSRDL